ncbi:MAG: redox-regulated ATPase YchF [Pseudomonadota bacterium]
MGFKCGIVGLPNIGKSTLFNALTATIAAEASNYPFCTIEPNTGIVAVPDVRLDKLSKIAASEKIIPTQLEFVDIAGLVKGASKGEGLGNQFLANIREVDAIIHVLRCFDDDNIIHVEDSVDPIRDAEIINTELILADLESLQKRLTGLEKKAKSKDKLAEQLIPIIKQVLDILDKGDPARKFSITDDNESLFNQLQLLTAKPVLYVCNVGEDDILDGNNHTKAVIDNADGSKVILISAAIEQEISNLDEVDKPEFLETLGLKETGLSQVIKAGYNILDLITFFTVGPKETHAWTVEQDALAPNAAGVIHTDFEKGFIRAETISYDDYIEFNGEAGCKENGKIRLEGKDYLVKDGDIFHFRFNV